MSRLFFFPIEVNLSQSASLLLLLYSFAVKSSSGNQKKIIDFTQKTTWIWSKKYKDIKVQEKESEWLQLVKVAKKDEFLLEKQKTENRFYDGSCNTFTDSFLYNLEEVWYDSIVIKWCRIF